jgi:hypothetical protein
MLRGTACQHQSTTRYIALSPPPAHTRRHGQARRDPNGQHVLTDLYRNGQLSADRLVSRFTL